MGRAGQAETRRRYAEAVESAARSIEPLGREEGPLKYSKVPRDVWLASFEIDRAGRTATGREHFIAVTVDYYFTGIDPTSTLNSVQRSQWASIRPRVDAARKASIAKFASVQTESDAESGVNQREHSGDSELIQRGYSAIQAQEPEQEPVDVPEPVGECLPVETCCEPNEGAGEHGAEEPEALTTSYYPPSTKKSERVSNPSTSRTRRRLMEDAPLVRDNPPTPEEALDYGISKGFECFTENTDPLGEAKKFISYNRERGWVLTENGISVDAYGGGWHDFLRRWNEQFLRYPEYNSRNRIEGASNGFMGTG